MITQLELLRALLADATADATCVVDRVTITAGRPAAPAGTDCTAIYVYGDNVSDLNELDESGCLVRSRWAMSYEIWVCYPEDWDDATDEMHAAAADCLYELMSLAWCALVEAKDSGYFCDCADLDLGELTIQPRLGGMVSALGSVTLPYFCPTSEDSPA